MKKLKNKLKKTVNSTEKRKILENFLSLFFIRIADFILPIIILPYLIATLGVEKFGLTAFAASLVIYVQNITQYGFSLSAVRDLSKNQDNPEKMEEIYNDVMSTKYVLLIFTGILFSILIFIVPSFSEYYLLYIFTFGIAVGDVLFPKWFFQGIEEMRFITIINIIFKSLFVVLVFIFIKQEADYVYVPLLQSIGVILGGIYSLFLIRKKYKIKYRIVSLQAIKSQLKTSFSSFVTLMVPTLYSNTSVFLLGIFTNNTLVGYYSGAIRITNAFTSLNKILTRTFYPFVNKTNKEKGTNKVNKIIFISGLLVSILMLVTANYSVLFILGEDMLPSILLVMILSLSPVLLSIRTMYGINSLLVKGLDALYMRIALFSSLIGLGLSFVLIPKFEHIGAAVVLISSQFIYAFLSFVYAKRTS